MSLYHVYFFNDIFFVFIIVVATMDHNEDILRVIGHLTDIGFAWRGGYELWYSLLESLLNIVNTINRSNNALYSIASYKERKQQEYVYGLRYNEIKKLKITKVHIYS